jgi:hypothetical protein
VAADTAATAAGINVASYSNRYYVFPYQPSCGWAGLAYVGYGEAYSNGSNTLGVYGHELGHNFGLLHAGSLRCAGQMPCTGGVAQYGDPFDIMGNTNSGGSHQRQAKVGHSAMDPASVIKIHTTGTATYTLSPIESAGGAVCDQNPGGKQSNLPGRISPADRVRQRYPLIRTTARRFAYRARSSRPRAPTTPTARHDAGYELVRRRGAACRQSYTDDLRHHHHRRIGVADSLDVTVALGPGSPTTTTLASSANPSALGTIVTLTASASLAMRRRAR